MKKFTKTLSIVLLVAMCVSMFTVSSFAAPVHDTGCSQTLTKVDEVPATCSATGMEEYWICPCGHVYSDAAGANYLSAMPVIPVDSTAHSWRDVAATTGTDCKHPGKVAHSVCDDCGKFYVNFQVVDSVPEAAVGSHSIKQVAAAAPDCANDGVYSHAECTVCGKLFSTDLQTELTAADTVNPATGKHNYNNAGDCTVCGADNPDHKFTITGANPAEFDSEGTYTYTVDAHHTVQSVKAGGYDLYDGQGFYFANGRVTVMGSAVASLIGTKSSIELTFTASDGCVVSGITLNNVTTVDTLKVDGFEQKGFLKGSTEAVFFTTNDSNPNNVKLYDYRNGKYISVTNYDFDALGGGKYTYTFNKAFLDTLEPGTYYARAFYGDGKYVSVGTIIISLSEANISTKLSFSNSNVSTTEFKYISGGLRPELYCELFRDSDAKLQVSNDGYSWKNVSVYDYYIEQSNGDDTSYAWLKTSMLDNMKASSNVYFRVIVPASARGAAEDAVSNWVKVTTGNNIHAVDTDKHVINSSKSLKFVASVPVDVVKVGSIALEEGEDYAMSKDGKTITLFADFLNKRTAGSTYTLTAITVDGDEELKTTFKILTTAQASASPRTGDDSNIALWSALVLMSGAAVVAVLPRLKKER